MTDLARWISSSGCWAIHQTAQIWYQRPMDQVVILHPQGQQGAQLALVDLPNNNAGVLHSFNNTDNKTQATKIMETRIRGMPATKQKRIHHKALEAPIRKVQQLSEIQWVHQNKQMLPNHTAKALIIHKKCKETLVSSDPHQTLNSKNSKVWR